MTRSRRDPRTERLSREVAGGSRRRFVLEAAATTEAGGRPRRDPRAERAAALVRLDPRPRLDRSRAGAPASSLQAPATPSAAPAAPAIRIVADPAFLVLVLPDAPGGRLAPHDRQLLGAARLIADAAGGAVVLADASVTEEAGGAGADRRVSLPAVEGYDPRGRAEAVVALVAALAPRHVLFPETADGGDLARRVAAALGEPLFAAAETVSARALTRRAGGGRVEQRAAPGRLVSITADAVAPHFGAPHEARLIEVDLAAPRRGAILAAERIPADPARVPLSEADFVLSAGNGVTDFTVFADLAQALGATPGASRVVCDAGLMPRDRQVGASGTVLEATCYIAMGIAGAPQHLQGIAKVEHVVAVNTDIHAAMIERADLSVVADAQAVMPALLAALRGEMSAEEAP
ncbi:electron transfer flavoprotein subunit alpha/FixB family protein [Segnochrobactrum spirostomi]|uniref:Electron transfer flavoprotein subunit alpha/FixB family protein n=1 Tax=Segnochrobactrum spirostomi TaxID=2608987 RepID=A0A6A7Y9A9_9HYPH|nr:electron transfer flavoprotein subunit alpha/FixB family protein [Segnochrobactrum spirostomi]MQT14232.1 electron transfer flavoprotein subunit alpha/FixB family protein [Segnochrobactrum spirostomi]